MSDETKPERAWIPNLIVFVVITVSMFAFPIRKIFQQANDPHRLAVVRGRTIAQAFDRMAITNRESAAGILRCVDPVLSLSTLPGMPDEQGHPMIAWSVVDLPHDASRDLPLLISRNVNVDSLAALTGRVSDVVIDQPPFGTNSVVIIFRDGRSAIIEGEALGYSWLPHFNGVQPSNRLFRP